jgi:lysozyme
MALSIATAAIGLALIAPGTPASAAGAGTSITPAYNLCKASSTEPTLRRGSRGDAVKVLQCALNTVMGSLVLHPLAVDGDFGGNTETAVYRFQACASIQRDGVVGPQTWNNLLYRLNNGHYCWSY